MTHYYTKVSNVSEVTKKFCHLLKAKKFNDYSYLTTYIDMLRTIYCSTHDPAYYSILIQTFIRTLLMMLIMVYDFGLFYFYLFSAFTQHQTFQYRTFSTDSYSSDSSAYFMFHLCMPHYITSLIEFILHKHHALFIKLYCNM